jgi:hypothetical protein
MSAGGRLIVATWQEPSVGKRPLNFCSPFRGLGGFLRHLTASGESGAAHDGFVRLERASRFCLMKMLSGELKHGKI